MSVDLRPATQRTAGLIVVISEDQLGAVTPNPDYRLGDLLDHVDGAALAFTAAARKDMTEATARGPSADASRLGDDWRTRIPRDLAALAEAWEDPAAWTGMTRAGGVDLPGEVAGLVALNEVLTHGWDVARASGQAYDADPASLEALLAFLAPVAEADDGSAGLFGPAVAVPEDAPLLDRIIGLTGRDPGWLPD